MARKSGIDLTPEMWLVKLLMYVSPPRPPLLSCLDVRSRWIGKLTFNFRGPIDSSYDSKDE